MRVKKLGFDHWGQEDPLEEGMATHSSILVGEPHGERNLAGYKESDMTEHACPWNDLIH